ncbi:ABC transporter ATP-binding protein [Patescibacteria group bacterium]|nr:ABC transporter ATP-binding protein [Patescibacteria group bacterium]MBU1963964.1 ABC transporter ATP-binding protein [Patescibacteria group bacterium]
MIKLDHLSKSFKLRKKRIVNAVKDLNFEIEKGEIFGLLGTNGAGKTTTLKLLSTLVYPSSGTAYIDGVDIRKNSKEIRKRIGVAFGGKMIYYRLTGRANMEFFGKVYNVPDLDKRINELSEFFEISDRIDDLVETYSTGMKAKLAIMRSLIHDPSILYLDEPTLGLDVGTAIKLRQKIKDLSKMGKTIIFCSHYLHEVQEMCDRIAIMNKGEVISLDSPDALRNKISVGKYLKIEPATDLDKVVLVSEFNAEVHSGHVVIPIKDTNHLKDVIQMISSKNVNILNIQTTLPSLEEAFIELIK